MQRLNEHASYLTCVSGLTVSEDGVFLLDTLVSLLD